MRTYTNDADKDTEKDKDTDKDTDKEKEAEYGFCEKSVCDESNFFFSVINCSLFHLQLYICCMHLKSGLPQADVQQGK